MKESQSIFVILLCMQPCWRHSVYNRQRLWSYDPHGAIQICYYYYYIIIRYSL